MIFFWCKLSFWRRFWCLLFLRNWKLRFSVEKSNIIIWKKQQASKSTSRRQFTWKKCHFGSFFFASFEFFYCQFRVFLFLVSNVSFIPFKADDRAARMSGLNTDGFIDPSPYCSEEVILHTFWFVLLQNYVQTYRNVCVVYQEQDQNVGGLFMSIPSMAPSSKNVQNTSFSLNKLLF